MFNEIFVINLLLKCYALKKSDIKCSEEQTFKLDLKGYFQMWTVLASF